VWLPARTLRRPGLANSRGNPAILGLAIFVQCLAQALDRASTSEAGTGMRMFADKPAEHADFEALMESTQRAPAKKEKKRPEPPKVPQRTATEAPRAEAVAEAEAVAAAEAEAVAAAG
jgi:hypothetical protein